MFGLEPPINPVIYEEAMHALTTAFPMSFPNKNVSLTLRLNGQDQKPMQDRPFMAVYNLQQHLSRALGVDSSKLAEKVHTYRQTLRVGGVVTDRFLFVPTDSAQPKRFSIKGFKNAALISY